MISGKNNQVIAFNIASTIILQGLAFFSGPLFSRLLGTGNYGIVSVYLTWVQVASIVLSLQAGGTLALARAAFPIKDQPKYQSSVLFLSSATYGILSIFILLSTSFVSFFEKDSKIMIGFALIHGWGLYCVSFLNSKFTYEFKAGKNFVLSISVAVLTIALSVFLILRFPESCNYWGRIAGQAIVYAIFGIGIFIYIISSGKVLYDKEYWSFTLPIAIPTIFHLIAGLVLNQSDRVMLKQMMGNSAAGIYALSATFGAVLSTIWNALNNSWVPFYYEYSRQKEIQEMKYHAKNYSELFTILTVGFILLSREVFHLYAHNDFWEGTDFIPLFAIGYYFVFLYSFPVNFEFLNKKTRTIAIGTISAAVVNITLNYVLINALGILGAVFATTISHGLQFLFHFFAAKRVKTDSFPFEFKEFVPGLLIVFGACFLYWLTKDIWLLRWACGAVLGVYILIKIIRRREIF